MIDAFGDESCGEEVIAYGIMLLPEHRLDDAIAVLAKVKGEFGGNATDPLHCREIFAPDARKKSPWRSLSMDNVIQLYEMLFAELAALKPRRIVTIAYRSGFPKHVPSQKWINPKPKPGEPDKWTKAHDVSAKAIASLCAQCCFVPLAGWPGPDRIRFWADPDQSLIETGGGKRQFSEFLGGYFDLGLDPQPKLSPVPIRGEKPVLLELADAIAFITRREKEAKTISPNNRRFKALFEQITPEIMELTTGPHGAHAHVPTSMKEYQPPPEWTTCSGVTL
jgi:hypothetical protein